MRAFGLVVLAACSFDPKAGLPVDAAGPIDTPPVEGTSCPADYVAVAGAPSRYRHTGRASYRAAQDDCKDDLLGHTHLVVFDNVAERDAIAAASSEDRWVGNVQMPDQDAPNLGWRAITGGDMVAGLWANGQPNDSFDSEDNRQNVASLVNGELEDYASVLALVGVCECDGRPVDATVEGNIR